jgi:hypothetical protein
MVPLGDLLADTAVGSGFGGRGGATVGSGAADVSPSQLAEAKAKASAGSRVDPLVRVGCLRLLLDLATAPGPSLKRRLADHRGLLAAVAEPLRAAAAAAGPPQLGDGSGGGEGGLMVDVFADISGDLLLAPTTPLFDLAPPPSMPAPTPAQTPAAPVDPFAAIVNHHHHDFAATASDSAHLPALPPLPPLGFEAGSLASPFASPPPTTFSAPSPADIVAAAAPAPAAPAAVPLRQGLAPVTLHQALPARKPPAPRSAPSPAAPAHTAAEVAEQALAVRLLGELAGADDAVRSAVLLLPGAFDGAVALLATPPHDPASAAAMAAAVESMRASATRFVRNLTLALVANDDEAAPTLSAAQVRHPWLWNALQNCFSISSSFH